VRRRRQNCDLHWENLCAAIVFINGEFIPKEYLKNCYKRFSEIDDISKNIRLKRDC